MSIFNKNPNTIVLKQTKPGVCGGTDATLDKSAPKEIKSDDILIFNVFSALGHGDISFISAFAAKYVESSFLFIETGDRFRKITKSCALIAENISPALNGLVKEYNISKDNGYHSTTHGLPENFGGSVIIKYSSGEEISFSDNQSPVITADFAKDIIDLFDEYMGKNSVLPPDLDRLKEIKFSENRQDGDYTKATLILNSDGTGINHKTTKFDDEKVYESEKPVDADTVLNIKSNINDTYLLLWYALPENEYSYSGDKTLTFVFEGGAEITVNSNAQAPDSIKNGFFNIELEMTTRH